MNCLIVTGERRDNEFETLYRERVANSSSRSNSGRIFRWRL